MDVQPAVRLMGVTPHAAGSAPLVPTAVRLAVAAEDESGADYYSLPELCVCPLIRECVEQPSVPYCFPVMSCDELPSVHCSYISARHD